MHFFTSVYGNKYLPFLRTFLKSVTDTHPESPVTVYWDLIDELEIGLCRLAFPSVSFRHRDFDVGGASDSNRRISMYLRYWRSFLSDLEDHTEVFFMDADMIVMQPLQGVFPADADLVYTWKVERFPINGGIIIARNTPAVRAFFDAWLYRTEQIMADEREMRRALTTFGAADQYAFVELLEVSDYTSPSTGDFGGGTVRFVPAPCADINETNCQRISDKTKIFHMKSGWHRILLEDGDYTKWRTKLDCEELQRYWSNLDVAVTNSSWREFCISTAQKHLDSFPIEGGEYVERGILNSEMLAVISMLYELKIDVVIESGRYLGQSTKILAQAMKGTKCVIHSTELFNNQVAEQAEKRLADCANVKLYYGDAAVVIPEIVANNGGKRIAILLDGPKGPEAFDLFSQMIAQCDEVKIGFVHDLRDSCPGMLNPNRVIVHEWFERIFFTDDASYVEKYQHLDTNCQKEELWVPYRFAWRQIGSYGPTLGCIFPTARDRLRAARRIRQSVETCSPQDSITPVQSMGLNPLKKLHRLPGYSRGKGFIKEKFTTAKPSISRNSIEPLQKFSDKSKRIASEFLASTTDLSPDDIFIDCGANIGQVVAKFAHTGAMIYAFEPNPYAFAELSLRFKHYTNVVCFPMAVLDRNDTVRLYMHEFSEQDQVKWSVGSSIMSCKVNVDVNKHIDVSAVDLSEFIYRLAKRVKLLKMDIEGAEYATLVKLIERGLMANIDQVLVETHKDKIPELAEAHLSLEKLIEQKHLSNINLEWI